MRILIAVLGHTKLDFSLKNFDEMLDRNVKSLSHISMEHDF